VESSLLFIPDISGFTKFVHETAVAHSRHVISELLELIIDSDRLEMEVTEVEGDAVVFHRCGRLPSRHALLDQAREMFEAFHAHLRRYETHRICDCGACRTAQDLTLKIVAHAGPIDTVSVKDFRKPYGRDVILAHRLLKNDVPEREYLLVTEEAWGTAGADEELPEWARVETGVSTYPEIGDVGYRYVPLSPLHANVPEPKPPRVLEKIANPIVHELRIARPIEELYEIISNFDLRPLWSPAVERLEYEVDRVNRAGTRHHCVVDGHLMEFETVRAEHADGQLVYGELMIENPMVDEMACYYILEPDGAETKLRIEIHFRSKPFPKKLLAPVFRFICSRRAPRIARAIREAAEAPRSADRPAPAGV
jgi:Protein of unknown function (DUF2652)/Polyketide cyclase / dehydrase and lipid transport